MANGHEELIDLQSEWEAEQQEAGYQAQTMLNESKWGLDPRLQDFLDRAAKRNERTDETAPGLAPRA